MKREYHTLRIEILKRKLEFEKALSTSSSDIVCIDDVELSKNDVKKLYEEFKNFLNSDPKNFKRVFIPVKLINKNAYWKTLQTLFNEVYEAK